MFQYYIHILLNCNNVMNHLTICFLTSLLAFWISTKKNILLLWIFLYEKWLLLTFSSLHLSFNSFWIFAWKICPIKKHGASTFVLLSMDDYDFKKCIYVEDGSVKSMPKSSLFVEFFIALVFTYTRSKQKDCTNFIIFDEYYQIPSRS